MSMIKITSFELVIFKTCKFQGTIKTKKYTQEIDGYLFIV